MRFGPGDCTRRLNTCRSKLEMRVGGPCTRLKAVHHSIPRTLGSRRCDWHERHSVPDQIVLHGRGGSCVHLCPRQEERKRSAWFAVAGGAAALGEGSSAFRRVRGDLRRNPYIQDRGGAAQCEGKRPGPLCKAGEATTRLRAGMLTWCKIGRRNPISCQLTRSALSFVEP